VFMLPRVPLTSQEENPFHWSAFGNAYDPAHPAGKCSWTKNYAGN
jgi:hypothetical protein